jgi:MarR family protease production transcriptional regulator HPr
MTRALYISLEERWGMLTKGYKLSPALQHILFILSTNHDPLTITDISKIGCWHISTVTRLLQPLIRENLVNVFQTKHNNKLKFVKLTDDGERLLKDILTTLVNARDFPFDLSIFTKEEVDQFLHMGLTILQSQRGTDFTHWVKVSEVITNN